MNLSLNEDIGIIIPARLDSTRLKHKLLIEIHGIPMIEHVRRRALKNKLGIPVVVASGDIDILNAVQKFDGATLETKKFHENGLSRVGEASQTLNWNRYIILQGDEILTRPKDLDLFIKQNLQINSYPVINAVSNLNSTTEITDQSIVKCTTSDNGTISYIFRKSPLTSSDSLQLELTMKICGLFGITQSVLTQVLEKENTPLASSESIEQLKFIELGLDLGACLLDSDFPSVNLQKDLDLVLSILNEDREQAEILNSIL